MLKRWQADLIDILSADPELVLQHARSLRLVTDRGYKTVRAQLVSTEKVTVLLDLVSDNGPEAAHGLLKLLRSETFQESLPRLSFLKNLTVDRHLSTEETRKRNAEDAEEEQRPAKQQRTTDPQVTEKQLMTVAGALTAIWKEVGIRLLDIKREKLDEIEANERTQKMRVFNMLYHWRNTQRGQATAARLHRLLSDKDLGVAPESLESLLEES
ncbi:hypothetical protein CRUP_021347 [Coryphaenoides rupestris]|nr:hypothetical protein CRUP_021347 [Coryphaenoides rupestris]